MPIPPINADLSASSASGPAYSGGGYITGAPINTGQVIVQTGNGSLDQDKDNQATGFPVWAIVALGSLVVIGGCWFVFNHCHAWSGR